MLQILINIQEGAEGGTFSMDIKGNPTNATPIENEVGMHIINSLPEILERRAEVESIKCIPRAADEVPPTGRN